VEIVVLHITERGEFIEQLTEQLKERGIANAAVVSIVGAVRAATLATMKADGPKTSVHSEHKFAELSGVGEVENGQPNLHVTLGLEGGQAFSGHLHAATVGGPYFVNVYVAKVD
jgi:predicted DNA-binding protein with PD1-like motif